jgi:type IV pilus assembly protein PilV
MLMMKTPCIKSIKKRQAGISLIEVLVVIVLFSFGLLGLVGLQARALQTSVGAEDSNRAALLANELVSTMWGANTVNLNAAAVTAWNTRVADAAVAGLPNGVGTVVVSGNVARITVTWRAPHEPAAQTHSYSTEVLIP